MKYREIPIFHTAPATPSALTLPRRVKELHCTWSILLLWPHQVHHVNTMQNNTACFEKCKKKRKRHFGAARPLICNQGFANHASLLSCRTRTTSPRPVLGQFLEHLQVGRQILTNPGREGPTSSPACFQNLLPWRAFKTCLNSLPQTSLRSWVFIFDNCSTFHESLTVSVGARGRHWLSRHSPVTLEEGPPVAVGCQAPQTRCSQPSDEYAYRILHPVRKPKYTNAMVPHTQDKQHSRAASQSHTHTPDWRPSTLKNWTLPEYVATHSHQHWLPCP